MSEVQVAVASSMLHVIQGDDEKIKTLRTCANPDPAVGFVEFLRHWWFLDQETKRPRQLGDELWEGQNLVIEAIAEDDWIFQLKARKLGFTTLATAFDAWVLRFRGANERVHIFSRREAAAIELIDAVKYGLNRLPDWMKLPAAKWSNQEIALVGGTDDVRRAVAYPANEETAVEATCTHGHVDEWARMRNPQRVWQAIEPSMAGTCHIITTGRGPANYASKYWVMTMNGDTKFRALFVPATARPGRTYETVMAKRKELPEQDARQEYPLSWEDSLFAGADLPLGGEKLDVIGKLGEGPRDAEDGHTYVKTWDIGRHADAAVCVVLDVTADPPDVVHYRRIRNKSYPNIQLEIEEVHPWYPGPTVIEDNFAGEAVRENVDLVQDKEVFGYKTTASSKPKMIKKLEVAIDNADIRWDAKAYPQLHNEVATYQIPDDNVIQDSVMALGIGFDFYTNPKQWRRFSRRKGKARVFTI